jgi:hypothetical protein
MVSRTDFIIGALAGFLIGLLISEFLRGFY